MLCDQGLSTVLHIDLSKKSFRTEKRPELFEKYLGGAGVAIQLLHENCPRDCDPLGPENPIILAVGPLTALFPLGSKTVAMFKSPHTGNLGESHCGGRSAVALRMAGYGALVIKGVSESPIYVAVHGNKVYFRDASSIWGLGSIVTGQILREAESGTGFRTIMRIGPAGEKLVSYACVTTETYRHFGRLGLGAVFGSKKLKSLIISGQQSLQVTDQKLYRETYEEIYEKAVTSPLMKKYHDLGTAENIMPLNELGGLPTRNLKEARLAEAADISGEYFAEHYLGRRLACSHCPVGCIHIAALREPDPLKPYFYKTSMISYDYEPMYALGSMLGGSDAKGLMQLMDRIEALGLDAMSAGVILAWATEALERGNISEKETQVPLAWGHYPGYLKAARFIVEQPNHFYRALAQGVERAASLYGGRDFALSFAGNEMPGYHTGPAAHLGVLVGARHSHLDNAGYSLDQKVLAKNLASPQEVAEALLTEEYWRQILSSLVVCFFAREIYKKEVVAKALQLSGFAVDPEALLDIGKEIHREKYRFKMREGFGLDRLRIPKRILETPSLVQGWDENYLIQVLEHVKEALSL
ncbi:MAG: aldehyde ferredoxin oxidoreductase family protein [Deltaproteobacteria bacterium]|nr:aldehyde ferredoxin oxidoreductase family protein [Deltaproteobacteria bacterium]